MNLGKCICTLACICLLGGLAAPAYAANVSGIWTAQMDNGYLVLILKADKHSFTGSAIHPQWGMAVIQDGKIDKNAVSFYIRRKIGNSYYKVEWKGDIVKEGITLRSDFAGVAKEAFLSRIESVSSDPSD